MTDNELPLRDFDEESEATDSETELLRRHNSSSDALIANSINEGKSNSKAKSSLNNSGQRRRSHSNYESVIQVQR